MMVRLFAESGKYYSREILVKDLIDKITFIRKRSQNPTIKESYSNITADINARKGLRHAFAELAGSARSSSITDSVLAAT